MDKRVAAILLLIAVISAPLFAEFELGFGFAPSFIRPDEAEGNDVAEDDFFENSFKTLHLGYRFWGIMYFSLDSIIMPPAVTEYFTSSSDGEYYTMGVYRPAMINLYDLGLQFRLWDLVLQAQMGVNKLHIYRQEDLGDRYNTNLGANLKLGLGLRFGRHFGLVGNLYSVQSSLDEAFDVLGDLTSDDELIRQAAKDKLSSQTIASIMLVMYL